ncbi:hypothetical protein DP939_14930 [Spongiactinospora rosea]|uniref:Secreted protein n=1 Tax=Spongiactinospora rosea TaxID=2248750 RepID=A0A366M0T2_9ACTN|nr:hypothetical protein [Spongiactinospora rosea]RBQ19229.1 hypothetical protein DP939_14930 [Spongiactinospora rosea]
MVKRVIIALAAPALCAAGLLTGGPAAAASPAGFSAQTSARTWAQSPIECRLQTVRDGRGSFVECREHGTYVHWIRCKTHPDSRTTEDITREFTGTRDLLLCEPGTRVESHSIGA